MDDSNTSVLIGAILGMARGLHLDVVAEGVEYLEPLQVLKGLSCPLAQGYYFSLPVPAAQIPALAKKDFLPRLSDVRMVAVGAGKMQE